VVELLPGTNRADRAAQVPRTISRNVAAAAKIAVDSRRACR